MPIIDPAQLEQEKQFIATVVEIAPGRFKGPWLSHVYDSRSECLRENIKANNLRMQKERGLNEHWQTPKQEEAAKARQKKAAGMKEKALMAEQIALKNK